MKKITILLSFLAILVGCSPNDTTLSTTLNPVIFDSLNNVYSMDLYLDVENDILDVEGELSYKNDDFDLNELYIILYPNADNPRPTGRNVIFDYFKINGEEASFEMVGNDDTAMHVSLGQTLSKGERITISYKYQFQYWDRDRMVTYDHYYLTLFFYPSVAIYDEEGWHIEPYSFRGETYYNTIGDYTVSLNVPEAYSVACSGKLMKVEPMDSRKILEYTLKDARDFSFSASSNYHLYERTLLGIDFEIYSIRELTEIEIEDSFFYLGEAMETMEWDIGDYYYDHFTLEYGYFYGMESSGVIYCNSVISQETVVHEVTHQWFYSMIGNDQANESFLDESLTTYAVSLYYYDLYGLEGYNGYLDYRTSLKPEFADRYEAHLGADLLRQVDEYGDSYAYLIYYHGPAMFRYYVEEFLDGDLAKMADILRVYYQEQVKGIATIEEFLDLLERESGVETTKEWFYLQLNEFQDFDHRP